MKLKDVQEIMAKKLQEELDVMDKHGVSVEEVDEYLAQYGYIRIEQE